MASILLDTQAAYDRMELILALEGILEIPSIPFSDDSYGYNRRAAYEKAERLLKQIRNRNENNI